MNYKEVLVQRLQTQHQALPRLTAAVASARLRQAPAPKKWSINDNIAHLAKYQSTFMDRIHQILSSTVPVFDPYNADLDREFPEWQKIGYNTLTETILADRIKILKLIEGLDTADLERKGIHTRYGEMDVSDWTEFFLLHEAHHLFTIFKLVHSGSF
jgi:hypothetical protein